ncbi:peptide deformylase [Ensifer sp. ENS07]|jgi:peptide deformylase|uniref:Peptide deformylase-like n=1 Tax=Ensifer adhaerens TaxID=106592 RepID=A0A9Q8YB42_ENSAD|nr:MULTISPECIES: peptide deformylase [Ensifer]MBD9635674.1 peptide deformylase [Ensifer sp. ENS07]USJ24454.1 peptide deformylase [Ensifer adhaerens]UTV37838.1 peptide deformylase [Ensifer adhaerens]
MAIRPIVRFPNPLLTRKAETITRFDAALEALAADLLDTMRDAPGVGITAPHIGILERLTVIELDRESGARTFVNPEVIWCSDEKATHTEGSVSMPGILEEVERPRAVRVRYQTLGGETIDEEADGFMATCLQHEIDQLDGIFWTQRLSRLKRDRAIKKFEKLTREQARG